VTIPGGTYGRPGRGLLLCLRSIDTSSRIELTRKNNKGHIQLKCVIAVLMFIPCACMSAAPREVLPFVALAARTLVLTHVNVIDGAGAPPRPDQTIVIVAGRLAALGPASTTAVPAGADIRDFNGYTALPGLVGMHDHLFYSASNALQRGAGAVSEPGILFSEIAYSAPRLYLAAGVTTIRTTGSIEPYTDLKVRSRIEAGVMPGPKLELTAPYLEGGGTPFAQMHELADEDEARRFVGVWAQAGMSSFKAYMHITRAELQAAAREAHRRGLTITGHLCSVTWPEAIDAGIDNLEHGPYTDTEFVSGKRPDDCPNPQDRQSAWLAESIDGPRVQSLIHALVTHHVAVTSTLPVQEVRAAGRPAPQRRTLEAMSAAARESYLTERAMIDPNDATSTALLRHEMEFERAFVVAGGMLLAGPDPTGNGGVLPGYGDQREVELLVEAGFSPVEAIQIATQNGARFLGREKDIGTLASGKCADLVLVKGDPSIRIADIENVDIVFKDGVGYDSRKLIESVRGQVGIR
jgi:imidazolonepropionase-like amidohydrolase